MAITLYHHPFSRAATVVGMLEEVGVPYTLEFVDLMSGAQKDASYLAINPMGKIPTLVDGDAVVTETTAIGLYLADRYGLGSLAPALDDPARGTYLRWSVYPASVIEPGCMAKAGGWSYRPGSAGWGTYESIVETLESALNTGPWLLGDWFTMADVLLGANLRWMLGFKMLDARPSFTAYVDRFNARPAQVQAADVNQQVVTERGLSRG